jgi:ankyrin repeat protein
LGNQLPTFHFPQSIGYTRFHHRLGEQGMGRDFPIFIDDNDVLDFIKETDDTQILVNLLNSICKSGNTILLEKIIKKRKIKPLLKDDRFKGFDLAFSEFQFQIMEVLKRNSYKTSTQDDHDTFIKAFQHGASDYIKYLVENGFNYKVKRLNEKVFNTFQERLSPTDDDLELVKYMVEVLELDFKYQNDVEINYAPLGYVINRNKPLIAEYFLSQGCDINDIGFVISDRKFTYLESVIGDGNADMVKMLLRRGARCTDNDNWALRRAVKLGYMDVVVLLLEHGADPMAVTKKEVKDIFEPEIRELILNSQSSINLKNKLSSQLAEKEPVKRKKRDF